MKVRFIISPLALTLLVAVTSLGVNPISVSSVRLLNSVTQSMSPKLRLSTLRTPLLT